ncbi:MAG: hypothetical protein ACK44Q_14520, partial [Pirellulaceae bacterium]
MNDLSLLSTALAAVATWRCCDLYWRPPLRSYRRQMKDDFLERSFVALHRLGGGGYLASKCSFLYVFKRTKNLVLAKFLWTDRIPNCIMPLI